MAQYCRRQASFHVAVTRFKTPRSPRSQTLKRIAAPSASNHAARTEAGPFRTFARLSSVRWHMPMRSDPRERHGRNRSCFRGADGLARHSTVFLLATAGGLLLQCALALGCPTGASAPMRVQHNLCATGARHGEQSNTVLTRPSPPMLGRSAGPRGEGFFQKTCDQTAGESI
jgi:hypothetical protein